ncbi:hypothetical protein [Prescottella agglutinans]|jgi:hypothetical protein|uniref:SAM-dependent methyltransferase n=1 Tax=Prescottella agglutinans TaxID=1644129 RepID=A0ABT6MLJ8_9NOCA|nr:hypothetical protein [Prescottella agglutinans]MDH6284825.1 hypothetical protein [Prescottella agglutinans]
MGHASESPAVSARRYAKAAMRWSGIAGVGTSLVGGALVAAQATRLFESVREQLAVAAAMCLIVGGVAVAGVVLGGAVWAAAGPLTDPMTRDRMRVIGAAQEMTSKELAQAIEALGVTEDRLLLAGRNEEARRVAEDRTLCLYVLGRRQDVSGPAAP